MNKDKILNILFDADDTLWLDSVYFRILENEFFECGRKINLSFDQLKSCLNNNLLTQAKGESGFSEAILKAAQASSYRCDDIIYLNQHVKNFLNHPIELTEGLLEFLDGLRLNKVIYTKGIFHEQLSKLNKSGLIAYFDNVIVVRKKNSQILNSVLKILQYKPEETLVIGNSIIHDVKPAIDNGMNAIWFNHEYNHYGNNDILPDGVIEIRSWKELQNKLAKLHEQLP